MHPCFKGIRLQTMLLRFQSLRGSAEMPKQIPKQIGTKNVVKKLQSKKLTSFLVVLPLYFHVKDNLRLMTNKYEEI